MWYVWLRYLWEFRTTVAAVVTTDGRDYEKFSLSVDGWDIFLCEEWEVSKYSIREEEFIDSQGETHTLFTATTELVTTNISQQDKRYYLEWCKSCKKRKSIVLHYLLEEQKQHLFGEGWRRFSLSSDDISHRVYNKHSEYLPKDDKGEMMRFSNILRSLQIQWYLWYDEGKDIITLTDAFYTMPEIKKAKKEYHIEKLPNKVDPATQLMRLWDITITPWLSINIGSYAISNKETYKSIRDLSEGKASYLTDWPLPKDKRPSLDPGQFSSWLKFIYAMIKYIFSKNIKISEGRYKVPLDEDFLEYFIESQKIFNFMTWNSEPLLSNSSYRRSNKSHAKKILKLSSNISIIDKPKGEIDMCFIIEQS